jgi:hypothetical protein
MPKSDLALACLIECSQVIRRNHYIEAGQIVQQLSRAHQ